MHVTQEGLTSHPQQWLFITILLTSLIYQARSGQATTYANQTPGTPKLQS